MRRAIKHIEKETEAPSCEGKKVMFAAALMLIGTLISVCLTVDFLRPVPHTSPF